MGTVQDEKRKREKDEGDADKGGKKMKTKQEVIVKAQKREREDEKGMEEKTARQQGMTDVSSLGAFSSGQAPDPSKSSSPAIPGATGNRYLDETRNDDEAPDKVQKIMSICI